MAFLKALLLIVSGLAFMNSFILFAARMESDCYVVTIVAVCAMGGFFLIDHVEQESRRRLAAHRDDVWARREGRR